MKKVLALVLAVIMVCTMAFAAAGNAVTVVPVVLVATLMVLLNSQISMMPTISMPWNWMMLSSRFSTPI